MAGYEIMNSRVHDSEEALARLAYEEIADRSAPRILVGGLGMGFTLAAALSTLPPDGRIEVVELVPAVVDWNRDFLSHLAGRPLDDPRVRVIPGDVAKIIRKGTTAYDAILLDVDNGPEGLTQKANDRIYSQGGLAACRAALETGGVLAIWSASPDPTLVERLNEAGFQARAKRVRPRYERAGARHVVWIAVRGP